MLGRETVVIGFLFLRYKFKIIQWSSDGFVMLTDTRIALFPHTDHRHLQEWS